MHVFNAHGACADVIEIVYEPAETGEARHLPSGSVGVITVDNVRFPYVQSLRHAVEFLSSIVHENEDDDIVEHHGAVFYRLKTRNAGSENWRSLIDTFRTDPTSFEVVLPRLLMADTPYVFFARKCKTTTPRMRRNIDE